MASTPPIAENRTTNVLHLLRGKSTSHGSRVEALSRCLLFVYVVIVASPMRFWMIRNSDVDYTWIFVLNYGASHGLKFGRDLLWTNGPLGYLTFPQNIGNNLLYGLLFQAGLWALLIATFHGLFFRVDVPLRRLALFSLAMGFASPLFWFNRNSDGVLLAGILVLLVMVRFHGGAVRYVAALVLIALLPFIKLSSGLHAALILSGFLLDQGLLHHHRARRRILAGVAVPLAVLVILSVVTIPTWWAFQRFVCGSWNLFRGYYTTTNTGPMSELVAALVVVPAIAGLLFASATRPVTRFYLLLLGPSLLFSLKHGFVRQQDHTANFFCFAILSLGLIALEVDFKGWRAFFATATFAVPVFFVLTQPTPLPLFFANASGVRLFRAMHQAWRSLADGGTPEREKALMGTYAPAPLLPPDIRKIVQDSTVAILSLNYSAAYFDGLNLRIYPVIQRYSAYTPYLDEMNAEWIRSSGPQFLVFDGDTIDDRHPWAENPATWLEIFRNYELRAYEDKTLLLERMDQPRFAYLQPVSAFQLSMPGRLSLLAPESVEFWSMKCPMSTAGSLRKLFFRIPMPLMTVIAADGSHRTFRSITDVLSSPLMGASLPSTLPEFAALFDRKRMPSFENRALACGGAGAEMIGPECQVQTFQPMR